MENNNKSTQNILTAFLVNLLFVAIELVGGLMTNSIAILSDSIHDLGDCLSIGLAFGLEKLSHKKPDDDYTYGYRRYSLVSAAITSFILVGGSVAVVIASIGRLKNPEAVNSKGMMIIAFFGVILNGYAALKTRGGQGSNERSISLHMLEDVLGWAAVLIGSVFMTLFGFPFIDPILSIAVSLFLFYEAASNISEVAGVLLEKTPKGFDMEGYRSDLGQIKGAAGVHHVHVWSFDGEDILSTIHIAAGEDAADAPALENIRNEALKIAKNYGIHHITVQLDFGDNCEDGDCGISSAVPSASAHSHHHHSHSRRGGKNKDHENEQHSHDLEDNRTAHHCGDAEEDHDHSGHEHENASKDCGNDHASHNHNGQNHDDDHASHDHLGHSHSDHDHAEDAWEHTDHDHSHNEKTQTEGRSQSPKVGECDEK
ncbi:MAG: cation transporter [Eubacteriaceae bacterium]|nr:cation transporter [Eubacteriaceae bacterium]